MGKRQTASRQGFTLVEILMVLGIVAVLAALVMAVFVRVREKGRFSVCQSNLKQIALAVQQYAHDHDGRFPSLIYVINKDTPTAKPVRWYDAVMPYTKVNSIFSCPSSQIDEPSLNFYAYNSHQINDIIWNSNKPGKESPFVGSHESKIVTPSTVALNFDTVLERTDSVQNGTSIETSCGPHLVATLHSGGINTSYLDGHVKWLSQTQQSEMLCGQKSNDDS